MTNEYQPAQIWQLDAALAHLGRESGVATKSVNPPVVRASTMVFQTLAKFKDSYKGVVFESPRYGRSGTSTNPGTVWPQRCRVQPLRGCPRAT